MRHLSIMLFWISAALPALAQAPAHYLPPGISFVRAVVSVETSYLTNASWQGLAERQGLLLAVAGNNPQSSLSALATATGHPEVLVAPYVPYGLSANGRRSMQTAVASPGRVLAVLAHHPGRMFAQGNDGFNFNRLDGTVAADTLFDFTPAYSVPVLFFAGEQDNLSGFVLPMGNFEWGRAMGNAPWTFICEPATTHTGNPLPAALTTALLEAIITRRLPAQNWAINQQPTLLPIDVSTGYLGDNVSRTTAAHADFTGDRSRASWLPDPATAAQWSAFVRGVPFALPAQPISLPSATVNFQALDSASSVVHPSNAAGGTSGEAAWKVCGNLKEGDLCYVNAHGGAVLGVPNTVRGAEWIRPHPAAAAFTGAALARFDLDADAEVFIAHDSRITTKPSWLTGWTNTGESLQVTTGSSLFSAQVNLTLFRRSFLDGETINLGPNGTTSGTVMYLVIVKPSTPTGGGLPVISVVTSDANAAETGNDEGAFIVSRSGSLAGSLTINYSVQGTSLAGSDYATLPGTVTIPDGEASATVPLVPIDDAVEENAETVIVELQAGSGYLLSSSASATVTIADNDGAPLPSVNLSVSHEIVTEGSGVSFSLTVSRSGSTAAALNTTLSVTGNAGYGDDYEAISLNVTIPSGSDSVSIPVNILNDGIVEAAETISFSVIPTTAYVVGVVGSVSVQIVDDDSPPAQAVTISVSPSSGSEDGGNPAVFTVSRASALPTPLSVSLSWAGSAQTGIDAVTVPQSVEIPASQTSVMFSVVPVEDAITEGAETVIANVLASSGVTPGAPSSATFTINDNDNSQRALMARQVFASPASGALRMDLYVPRGVSGPVPCVLLLAGGGWQNGTRSTLGIASALNTAGMACAAVDYRLTGVARWPAQIHDVKAAVRWLRSNSAALGLDPERFGIHGQGSGGHLGLMSALSAENANVVVNTFHTDLEGNSMGNYGVSDRVHAVCAWYAPTDLLLLDNAPSSINHNLATAQTGYLMGLNPPPPIAGTAIQTIPERTASAYPGLFADHSDPPVLLMHGSGDQTTPIWQSALLHHTLGRAGVRSTFLPVVGASNSLPSDENNPVVAFFTRELAGLDGEPATSGAYPNWNIFGERAIDDFLQWKRINRSGRIDHSLRVVVWK